MGNMLKGLYNNRWLSKDLLAFSYCTLATSQQVKMQGGFASGFTGAKYSPNCVDECPPRNRS